jgi:hypothetical protein
MAKCKQRPSQYGNVMALGVHQIQRKKAFQNLNLGLKPKIRCYPLKKFTNWSQGSGYQIQIQKVNVVGKSVSGFIKSQAKKINLSSKLSCQQGWMDCAPPLLVILEHISVTWEGKDTRMDFAINHRIIMQWGRFPQFPFHPTWLVFLQSCTIRSRCQFQRGRQYKVIREGSSQLQVSNIIFLLFGVQNANCIFPA